MHPLIGRFMQYDPLMYVDGMNTTSYVQNMPIMMIDPIGWKLVVTIWTTGGESGVGHAGIAVSNYDGKKPNGSYTYYDLWPGEPVNFVSMDAISYVKPFRNELFIESNKVFRQNFLYPDEEIAPDGDIEKFKEFYNNPNFDELNALDGVGPEKAGNIVDWCKFTKSDSVKDMMFRALINELEFSAPEVEKNQSLSGKTFVITGAVHIYKNRDEFKKSVEARGGKVAGSVSKNTDFLVNNDIDSTSGKNAKAKSLGVPIISEEEFIERFGK